MPCGTCCLRQSSFDTITHYFKSVKHFLCFLYIYAFGYSAESSFPEFIFLTGSGKSPPTAYCSSQLKQQGKLANPVLRVKRKNPRSAYLRGFCESYCLSKFYRIELYARSHCRSQRYAAQVLTFQCCRFCFINCLNKRLEVVG